MRAAFLFPGLPVAFAVVLGCGVLDAATFIAPRNLAELASQSDAVVLARARPSSSHERGGLIFTDTELEVVEAVSGPLDAGDIVVAQAPGGELDDGRFWSVTGAPRFVEGATYFVCLQKKDERDLWIPTMLSWGVLRETFDDDGEAVLVPDGKLHVEDGMPRLDGGVTERLVPYVRDAFLPHLARVLRGEEAWNGSGVESEYRPSGAGDGGIADAPDGCSFMNSGGRNFRWRAFDGGGTATMYCSLEGDLSLANRGYPLIQQAMDMWMSVSDSSFNLRFGGARRVTPSCGGGQDSVNNFILLNDPCSDIGDLSGCGGVLAYGGPRGGGSHSFDGTSWNTITGWIVVVNNGSGCLGNSNWRIMMAHELGHGLGFGHGDDSGALMYASCCRNVNTTDRTCGRYTYPAQDASNDRPQADAGTDRSIALAGNRARIRGTVADDGSLANVDTTWTKLVGPGSVVYDDPGSLDTVATFSRSGSYLLGLEAHDGELLDIDTVNVDVEIFVGSNARLTFQQGVDGYSGTRDTTIQENAPAANLGARESLEVDADDPGDSGLASQGLLRFDGIFGSGSERIPPGAAIHSAWLELTTTNQGDGASFHRMMDAWNEASTWESFGSNGIQAGGEALAATDATSAGVGEPARIDVTASVDAWSRDPEANLGWALLPSGDDGWDFDSSEGDEPPRLVVEYPVFERRTLIAIGDEWDYFRGTANPPSDWNDADFVPTAAWRSGATGIGYGDGDDATVLTDMEDRYMTVYCRREFAVDEPAGLVQLLLRIDYDDGFVAYLNGVEVARSTNMGAPGSPVGRNTEPSPNHEAGAFEDFGIAADALRAGVNVLAVEVHNAGVGSSDLSFIPELTGDVLLVAGGAEWSYLPGTEPAPSDWNQPSFDDRMWATGAAGIGYGDGDDFTELDDMRGNYVSVFCRREFIVECPTRIESLLLTVVYDDGVVIWLNGVEVDRFNMPRGAVGWSTSASSSVESARDSIDISGELLREGTNVLAVSVHNASIGNSDLSFMAVLVPFFAPEGVGECDDLGPRFRRGDASPDGELDVSDAILVLLSLFGSGEPLSCPDAADFDDDGAIRINDPIAFLGHLFQGAPPPPAPHGRCGGDPTEDELGECIASGC